MKAKKELPDGSFLAMIYPSPKARRDKTDGVTVRVIKYTLNDPGRSDAVFLYRLITTILDPEAVPAHELACLYAERQEIEFAFDERKTHQRGSGVVFRSKTPQGVIQEIYGYLLAHFAIRTLMNEAAGKAGVEPTRMSFRHTVRVVKRKLQTFQSTSPLKMGAST